MRIFTVKIPKIIVSPATPTAAEQLTSSAFKQMNKRSIVTPRKPLSGDSLIQKRRQNVRDIRKKRLSFSPAKKVSGKKLIRSQKVTPTLKFSPKVKAKNLVNNI